MARNWTEDETVLALCLYLQTPYGRIHDSNPTILNLAKSLDRTAGSVTMKMLNLAALNPEIINSGRTGLTHGSKLDKRIWSQYSENWSFLERVNDQLSDLQNPMIANFEFHEATQEFRYQAPKGTTKTNRNVEQRKGQDFFRKIVMTNFESRCCVTDIAEPKVLVASHIKPWAEDEKNRLNPKNGIALSATIDKAFDRGLLTIDGDLHVIISDHLLHHDSETTRSYFQQYHRKEISKPNRFMPDSKFVEWHNEFFEQQQQKLI